MQHRIINATAKFDFQNEIFVICLSVLGPIVIILNLIILISGMLIMAKGNKPKSYIVLGNICLANLISIFVEIVITCKSFVIKTIEYQPNKAERGK